MAAGPVGEAERAARRSAHDDAGELHAVAAFEAYQAGDLARAIEIVEEGERACRYGRPSRATWSAIRERITEAAVSAPCPVGLAFRHSALRPAATGHRGGLGPAPRLGIGAGPERRTSDEPTMSS
jgi:hypothetical protein